MTSNIIHKSPLTVCPVSPPHPCPFPPEQAIRLEKAIRLVSETLHRPRFGDVVLRLRLEPTLSDEDFRAYFAAAVLTPRTMFQVEAWTMSLAHGGRS